METHGDDSVHQRRNSMATLVEELIMEILLRLPIKTLLCLRCVSKSWLSLISSPHFAKAHLLLSASNKDYTHHQILLKAADPNHDFKYCSLSSLLSGSFTEAFDLDYPGKNAFDLILQRPVVGSFNRAINASCGPRIVGSLNGLVCLSVWAGGDEVYLFLWNPFIRKFKSLPGCGFNCENGRELVFSRFGFAYDDSQDDYKVVCILPLFSGNKAKIYSLKSNSWRSIDGLPGSTMLDGSGKLVNRKLHWCDSEQNIISLDLADEQWAQVVMPQFKRCRYLELTVFGSDLSAMCNHRDGLGVIADVWVMKEYGVKESWTKMFTIKSPHFGSNFSPIFMSNEGEILIQYTSRLAKYNPEDGLIKYPNTTTSALYCWKAVVYVKSLVCPF